jgi:predicted protein tyrosine phosphatase
MRVNNISRNDLRNFVVNDDHLVLIQLAAEDTWFEPTALPFFATFKIVLADNEFEAPPASACVRIIKAIAYAVDNNYDVIVQCDAGKSRSGAVVKYANHVYGALYDNEPTEANMKIYHEMIRVLGVYF